MRTPGMVAYPKDCHAFEIISKTVKNERKRKREKLTIGDKVSEGNSRYSDGVDAQLKLIRHPFSTRKFKECDSFFLPTIIFL